MATHRSRFQIFSIIVILTMLFSGFSLPSASAQGKDGLKRQVNPRSGRVSFLSPESGSALPASQALGIASLAHPADPALALAKRFGSEFGLKNPERDLSQMKTHRAKNGRITARYQQKYQGIPVMGGELIVSTNANGDLYSMNGEVSSDLSLSTQATISSEQAKETVLRAAAKWYRKTSEDFLVSEPELWVYDESLLRPSTRPVELVWRMEVTPKDAGIPIRELVLVNAQRGSLSLHFNQIDTAWSLSRTTNTAQNIQPTETIASAITGISTRETNSNEDVFVSNALTGGTTLYVATTGNDLNSCLSTDSPCQTINAAIGKAAAGDTIKVTTGTYTGTGTEVVLINKDITLSGGWNGSFTAQNGISVIAGQGLRRGITVSDGTVFVDHFSIQNGFHNTQGGGIYNSSILTLSNSLVSSNVSHLRGGGIFNSGTLTINNTIVSDNSGGDSLYGDGNGNGGGGIFNSYGMLTINNTAITGNRAGSPGWNAGGSYGGAGILNYSGTVNLNTSLVSGNMLLGLVPGSAINAYSGTFIVRNSTLSGNGGGQGHAIDLFSGTLTLNNSTISSNQSQGIFISSGVVNMQNTIIAGNGANGDCFKDNGTINSFGYNLIGKKPAECVFTAAIGDIIGTSASPINPNLTLLQDNGGPTFTHALINGSPAINAGNPVTPGSGGSACLGTDQRGISRPADGRCDIGAYEGSVVWSPSYLVSTYTASRTPSPALFFAIKWIQHVSLVISMRRPLTIMRSVPITCMLLNFFEIALTTMA